MNKFGRYYGLSDTEANIMELLWELEEPRSLREIMNFLNERLEKNWKQQTVSTYLLHLENAGLLRVDKRFARLHLYFPTFTKEEYKQKCIRELVEELFDNSIANLVCTFTGGEKLPEKEQIAMQKLM